MKQQQRYDLVTKVAEQLWAVDGDFTFKALEQAVSAAGGANAAAQSVVYKDRDGNNEPVFGGLDQLVSYVTETAVTRTAETVATARGRDGAANRFLALAEATYRWPSVERVVCSPEIPAAGQYRKSLARLLGGAEVMVIAASLGRAVRLAEQQGYDREAAQQTVQRLAASMMFRTEE